MPIDVALVHFPVVNRCGETIGSAVTNLDLHDIARAGRTYGVRRYWVITPDAGQQELARQIVGHWTDGYGGTVNPDRQQALSIITVCASFEEALAEYSQCGVCRPTVLATCARRQANTIGFTAVRNRLQAGESFLLLLGTAWGLAPEIMAEADAMLPPLTGPTDFNHLSVRSAASIVLDRLLAEERLVD